MATGSSSQPTVELTSSDDELVANIVKFRRAKFDRQIVIHLMNLRKRAIAKKRRLRSRIQKQELPENQVPRGDVAVDGHHHQQHQSEMPQVPEQQLPENPVANGGVPVDYDHQHQQQPLDMPQVPRLNGLIGRCSKPFEKQLMASDVNAGLSRLTINKNFAENNLMPMLNADDGNIEDGIWVNIYDSEGREYSMKFKFWSNKYYVLTSGWNDYQKANGLREDEHLINLWMFRHVRTGKLNFVVTWRRKEGVIEANNRGRRRNQRNRRNPVNG